MKRAFAAVVLVVGTCVPDVVTANPARAICVGPRIRHEPAEAARGGFVTIAGDQWGMACYDHPPPPGVGGLGAPVSDIAISFVQGDRRIMVARGAANGNYRFLVRVRVPTTLEPGDANIVATWQRDLASGPIDVLSSADTDLGTSGVGTDGIPDPLRITTTPPPRQTRAAKVATFGPGSALSATLELPKTTLPAGSTMNAVVVVRNGTGQPIDSFACRGTAYVARLVGKDHAQDPDRLLCRAPVRLPIGESQWPVAIAARYLGCSAPNSTVLPPSTVTPHCLDGSEPTPPIPRGKYRLLVEGPTHSSPPFPEPSPVTIRVT